MSVTTPTADGDVDLRDFAAFQPAFSGTEYLSYRLDIDADDGTEVNDSVWYADGYAGSGHNLMGAAGADSYDIGLRFHLPEVQQGESFAYARLVVHGSGSGQVDSMATLRIVGIDQDSPDGFDVARPSELLKTGASVAWDFSSNWPEPSVDSTCTPLRRYSPDISDIINEIVSRPDWGTGASGKTLALVVRGRRLHRHKRPGYRGLPRARRPVSRHESPHNHRALPDDPFHLHRQGAPGTPHRHLRYGQRAVADVVAGLL